MSSDASSKSESDFYVGEHRIRYVPPDTLRIWWKGRCTRDDFSRIMDWGTRQGGGKPYFVIADVSEMTVVDPEARQLAVTDTRALTILRVAMIGASFHMRVIMSMVARAMVLFHREQRDKMRFFDREADALAWLKQERTRLGLDM